MALSAPWLKGGYTSGVPTCSSSSRESRAEQPGLDQKTRSEPPLVFRRRSAGMTGRLHRSRGLPGGRSRRAVEAVGAATRNRATQRRSAEDVVQMRRGGRVGFFVVSMRTSNPQFEVVGPDGHLFGGDPPRRVLRVGDGDVSWPSARGTTVPVGERRAHAMPIRFERDALEALGDHAAPRAGRCPSRPVRDAPTRTPCRPAHEGDRRRVAHGRS